MARDDETSPRSDGDHDQGEPTSLEASVSNLLEETRILLPGTQTLFGFQLIVVFNSSFHDRLSSTERNLHLLATMLTIAAIALFMTPAAYRRQIERDSVSRSILRLASRLLVVGTLPLAAAICIEAYLVSQIATSNGGVSLILAIATIALFVSLWYVLPRLNGRQSER